MFPRFSVISVNYNNCNGLERTVKSVTVQNYPDYEYIVIDGGSTDGSVDIIMKYEDKISYWVSEPDDGVYEAMNKAVMLARGTHCIFMNSGDEFYSSSVLSEVAKYGDSYDLGVGISSNVSGGKVQCKVYPPKELSLLFWENYSVIHQAAFMRTDMLRERLYDTNYRIVADWKYMFSEYLTRQYTYLALPIIICKFEGGGISDNTERRNAEREQAKEKLLPPMLYADSLRMNGLRLLAVDEELRFPLNCVLESRTLTKWLKKILRLLIVMKRLWKK